MGLGDWALWIALAVGGAGVLWLVWRAFGVRAALTVGAALAAAAAPFLAFLKGQQSGAAAQRQEQTTKDLENAQDTVEAMQRANDARAESDRLNDDPERLRESDGWRRD